MYRKKGHGTGQIQLPENYKLKNYQSPYIAVRHSISDLPGERDFIIHLEYFADYLRKIKS